MNFELRTDMKAAQILEYQNIRISTNGEMALVRVIAPAEYSDVCPESYYRLISLADPATRDAVVQALGEKYGVDVTCVHDGDTHIGWSVWSKAKHSKTYVTRLEALRHAVDEEIEDE